MRSLKEWFCDFARFPFLSESPSQPATLSRPTDLPGPLQEAADRKNGPKLVAVPEITVADFDKRLALKAIMTGRRNSKRFVIGDDESAATTPDSPMCDMLPKVDSDNNLHIPREWYSRASRLRVGDHLT